jgi:hypothetical protein
VDDVGLEDLLVSRGVLATGQLGQLPGPGSARDRVLAAGLITSGELERLVAEAIARTPTPPAGVPRTALETRDSDLIVHRRAHTVTSDRPPAADSSPSKAGGYPELAPGAIVVTETGGELVVERELGRGGMGIVYLVRDPRLKRRAALKLVRGGGGPQRVERFRREAEVTAHLAHPGVPPVYEAGLTADGLDYLLLRYVDGRSLSELLGRVDRQRAHHRRWLRRRRFVPPRDLLQALIRAGETLAYAHSRGIVHRDLKPDNIMVGAFGEVLVMDWGLARDAREASDRASRPTPAAQRETLVGTVAYMAPEQAREDEVDARADVFALGAILFEVLTGRPPFVAPNFMQTLELARAGAVPRARDLVPEVAVELDAIAARATAARPEERYATAEALVDDLRAFIEGRAVSVYEYRPREWVVRTARAHPTLVMALALLAAGVVVVVEVERAAREEQVRDARADALDRWADLERRPASQFDAKLGQAWTALQAADRWHGLAPDAPDAASARLRAAFLLGEIAYNGEQWALAEQAFRQALLLGVDDVRAMRALERVQVARTAAAERRRRELRDLLEKIEASDGMHPEQHVDAVFEVVRRAEGATAELTTRLEAIADELARVQREALRATAYVDTDLAALDVALEAWRAQDLDGPPLAGADAERLAEAQARLAARAGRHAGADAPWLLVVAQRQATTVAPGRRQLAFVLCEALGRLNDPAAVPALRRYVLAEADGHRAAAAGRALVRLGHEALAAAATTRRFGPGSPYAEEIRHLIDVRSSGGS